MIVETFFYKEINLARGLIKERSYSAAFFHLERAHIIGQTSVKLHMIAHFYMLRVGFLKRDVKDVFGQIIRIVLGTVGSSIGKVPTGNTGGSNVSMFVKMEIPKDIEKYLYSKKEK